MQISVVQGNYLVLNIVGDIQYETIVRVVWPPQLQLVEVDRDQVSFRLGFKVNFLSFFLMRNKKFFTLCKINALMKLLMSAIHMIMK